MTLDVPYSFAVEPGFRKTQFCANFRPEKGAFDATWRDPTTGLVMLRPRFLDADFYTDAVPLSSVLTRGGSWSPVQRRAAGSSLLTAFTNINTPATFALGAVTAAIAAVAVKALVTSSDKLEWAIQTNYLLAPDEGFAVSHYTSYDELPRYENWGYFQWDNVAIHVSSSGVVRVYRYIDRTNTSDPTKVKLFDEFTLFDPGEINHKHNYFMFIPAPPWGLLILHALSPPKSLFGGSSDVLGGAVRSKLVQLYPMNMGIDDSGPWRLFDASALRIALNPNIAYTLGLFKIRYPSQGRFLDAPFDPGYKPTLAPVSVLPIELPNGQGSTTAGLRKADDSAFWAPASDQYGRVEVNLYATDDRYTPFVGGWDVAWNPVFANRATTPLVLATSGAGQQDKVLRLEWSRDENLRDEGTADVILGSTAGKAIALRGDSTCLVEYSPDGAAWTTAFGGFAKDFDVEFCSDFTGWSYKVRMTLCDLWERFRETRLMFESANDGNDLGTAINKVLVGGGFGAITTIPAGVTSVKLPTPEPGQAWRFAPSKGDTAEEMLKLYLFMLRQQYLEWILRYDWTGQTWVIEKKARDVANVWTIDPRSANESLGSKIWRYQAASGTPQPPEANIVIAAGVDKADSQGYRVVSRPISNQDSLTNTAHVDYLGRTRTVLMEVEGVTHQLDANKMARRLFDAVCHRRFPLSVNVPNLQLLLAPNVRTLVKDVAGATLLDTWIKRRTVVVTQFDKEEMTLELDTVWEGPIR